MSTDNQTPAGPPLVGIILSLFAIYTAIIGELDYMVVLLGLLLVLTLGFYTIWYR